MPRLLLAALMAMIVLAPLPFGSVERVPSAVLASGLLALAALWTVWRRRRGMPAVPWREDLLRWGLIGLSVGAVQLLSLPPPLLRDVSPRTVSLRAAYAPEVALATPADAAGTAAPPPAEWRALSLDSWATRRSVLRLAAFVAGALITVDLAAFDLYRRRIVAALIASGAFQAIYGLLEYASGHQHILGFRKVEATDVATGTFINRNHFAGYLEMTIPLAVGLSASLLSGALASRGSRSRGGHPAAADRGIFAASAALLLALVMLTALACSRSRTGIASAVASLCCTGAYLLWRGRARLFAAAVAVVVAATLLLFAGDASRPILSRFEVTGGDLRSALGRWTIWRQVGEVIASFPVLGVGLGAFEPIFPAFRTSGEGYAIAHAHNEILELSAETGLLGAGLVLAGLLVAARRILRRPAERPEFGPAGFAALAGILALGFHSLVDFNLSIPSNAFTLAVLAGLVSAWKRPAEPARALDRSERGRSRRAAWAAPIVAVALSLVALAPAAASLTSRPLERDDSIGLSERARDVGGAAAADLQALLASGGGESGFPPGTIDYLRRKIGTAIDLQREALRRVPFSSRGHLTLAVLGTNQCVAESLGGRREANCADEAMVEIRKALQVDPAGAWIRAQAALFLLQTWPALTDPVRAEALPILDDAVRLNPADEDLRAGRDRVRGGAGTCRLDTGSILGRSSSSTLRSWEDTA